jgi:hypothetical protein
LRLKQQRERLSEALKRVSDQLQGPASSAPATDRQIEPGALARCSATQVGTLHAGPSKGISGVGHDAWAIHLRRGERVRVSFDGEATGTLHLYDSDCIEELACGRVNDFVQYSAEEDTDALLMVMQRSVGVPYSLLTSVEGGWVTNADERRRLVEFQLWARAQKDEGLQQLVQAQADSADQLACLRASAYKQAPLLNRAAAVRAVNQCEEVLDNLIELQLSRSKPPVLEGHLRLNEEKGEAK